jgi:hypothetical protein
MEWSREEGERWEEEEGEEEEDPSSLREEGEGGGVSMLIKSLFMFCSVSLSI